MDIYNIEYDKSTKYMSTNYVKLLQNKNNNQQLTINNILSLLMYCNCDNYQNKWSQTFRRIPNNENNLSLKSRHSNFYYSSKYLRDFAEYFGEKLIDEQNKNLTLFHGVSETLYFIRTITQFNGALSTSKEIAAALNFSNNIGIVLELKYSFSVYPLNAKYLNCSFFSDYVNEKECLLIGGIPMMVITNIINVSTAEMYRKYINALNIINCILNGNIQQPIITIILNIQLNYVVYYYVIN